MECQLLDLHFAQLVRAWSKSKHNVYSDISKQEYHKNLKSLFDYLKKEKFCKLSEIEKTNRKLFIDFFFRSIEFLDNSTHNLIPFEIIECLKFAQKDWIPPDKNNFIIVTSFTNNMHGFSFDQSLALDNDIYINIKATFGIEFTNRLIQINLPKYLSRDYFANVVLYHELGHFIDLYYKITDPIADDFSLNYSAFSPTEITDLKNFFPFLNYPEYTPLFNGLLKNHIREYFADIFASQYMNFCSCKYVDYITGSSSNWYLSHPSTKNRNDLVNLFLANNDNFLIQKIKESTYIISKTSLSPRYKTLNGDDFINLVPIDIENPENLHSLFLLGWDLWLLGSKQFSDNNQMSEILKPGQFYQIINNLIEKSIGNYIIKTDWEKIKK